jgi:hypothetical protein
MFSGCSRRARMRRNAAGCALSYIVLQAGVALAGHAPLVPEPRTILPQNGDPGHVVVGTRRGGYFVTQDAGSSWSWLCEAGVGYDDEEVYPGVLLASGTLVVSTGFGGVASSGDGCSFTAWLPSMQPFVADVRARVGARSTVLALEASADGAAFVNRLWESTDDAITWQPLGASFAADEQAVSFALGADGAVYVGTTGTAGAALLRFDATVTSSQRVVLTGDAGARPRVVGVSGSGRAARVYLVLDYEQIEGLTSAGDVALFSVDGGDSFSPLLASAGDLPAAALSLDGKKLALGGEDEGIQLLDGADQASKDAAPVKVSALEAHALAWDTAGNLYAAGHEADDGFSVGISGDDGRTFRPLFALCQVHGPLDCPAESSVGGQCLATGETGWDVRKEVADSHACDTAQAGAASEPSPADTGTEHPTPPTDARSAEDRGCQIALPGSRLGHGWLYLMMASFSLLQRWRRRATSRPS